MVEKILAQHEALREDWPVDGTTGYEFANLVLGLLIDPAGEAAFSRTYSDFTGRRTSVRRSRARLQAAASCATRWPSELNVLARDAARIARQNPRTADFTRNILQRALKEIVACFPVYRTYVDGDASPTEDDRRDLDWAVAQARRERSRSRSERLRLPAPAADRRSGSAAAQRLQPA